MAFGGVGLHKVSSSGRGVYPFVWSWLAGTGFFGLEGLGFYKIYGLRRRASWTRGPRKVGCYSWFFIGMGFHVLFGLLVWVLIVCLFGTPSVKQQQSGSLAFSFLV